MLDGDGVAVGRVVGKVVGDRIGDLQLPIFFQQEDRGGSELLRDGAQPKDHLRLQGHAQLQVGHAGGTSIDDRTIPQGDDCRSRLVVGVDTGQEGLDLPGQVLVALLGSSDRGHDRQCDKDSEAERCRLSETPMPNGEHGPSPSGVEGVYRSPPRRPKGGPYFQLRRSLPVGSQPTRSRLV